MVIMFEHLAVFWEPKCQIDAGLLVLQMTLTYDWKTERGVYRTRSETTEPMTPATAQR